MVSFPRDRRAWTRLLRPAGSEVSHSLGARRANAITAIVGGVLGITALAAGPFLWLRPNRIVEGEPAVALASLGATGWTALALWSLAAFGALWSGRWPWRRRCADSGTRRERLARSVWNAVRGFLAGVSLLLLLAAAGDRAAAFAATEGTIARSSFGWGFYLFIFALYLVIYAAMTETPDRTTRIVFAALPFVGVVALTAAGQLGELGIVREWALARSTFARETGRHLFYALGATGGAMLIGIPLGVLAARRRRARAAVMGLLNVGQVLPVLAFIGIMMPILGALSDHLPGLRSLGISGIGWAPVMIVLLVYALYPITRNTLISIQQLEPAVMDAAKGMGMGRNRTFWEVELPLAFPVVLAGVRIALVQSTAGAIIAAFVGGGGLGTVVFLGLEQTSMDLVLVGVLPIVALAVCFDALLRSVEHLVSRGGATRTALANL